MKIDLNDYEKQISIYEVNFYKSEYDLVYLKNFYCFFKYLKISEFMNLMRFLSKVI